MTSTSIRTALLALVAAAALPVAATAQDQEPPTGPSFEVGLTAPASVAKAKLKKGFAVKVTCEQACTARLMLAGRIGIVTTKSVPVAAGQAKKVTLKAQPFQVREIDRGTKLTVSVDARSDADGGGSAVRKVKVR